MSGIDLVGLVRRAPRVAATLAGDLGGSRLRTGLVVDGRVEHLEACASGADQLATFLDVSSRLIAVVGCARIGIAVPGVVEGDRVVDTTGGNTGLAGLDIVGAVEDVLGLSARLVNDAVAAGIGESRFGAARGASRAVVLSLGERVGVCVLDGGRPMGAGPLGGGILGGWVRVADTSEHADSLGARGTIEALCAAPRLVDYSGPAYASIADVFAGVRRGDVMARHGVARYRRMLVRSLAALALAHAPDVLVVGGGAMTRGTPVLDGVEEAVNARLGAGLRVAVRRAQLGERAALLGVAALC